MSSCCGLRLHSLFSGIWAAEASHEGWLRRASCCGSWTTTMKHCVGCQSRTSIDLVERIAKLLEEMKMLDGAVSLEIADCSRQNSMTRDCYLYEYK